MKKIFVICLCVLTICGCNKKEEKIVKKEVFIASKKEEKTYYVSNVSYIDHDDYYIDQNKSVVNVYKNVVNKETNNIIVQAQLDKDESNINDNLNDESKETIDDKFFQVTKDEKEEITDELNNNENNISESDMIIDSVSANENLMNEININQDDLIQDTLIEEDTNKEEFLQDENITVNNDVSKAEEIKKAGYYSPSGKYLGESNVKVVDVSYYQGDINWDVFAKDSDCYGVILRLGYYDTLDKKFEQNINELKRLNIPYGIYLFSYSTTINGSIKEANFTNQMIDKYDLKPTLGVYYDIESWTAKNGASSNIITKDMYDDIISNYINNVSNHLSNKYKVKVYSGRWYAMNRLSYESKKYVDWVAEYDSTCKFNGSYSMWQYTSKGNVPGINGNVDISYLY